MLNLSISGYENSRRKPVASTYSQKEQIPITRSFPRRQPRPARQTCAPRIDAIRKIRLGRVGKRTMFARAGAKIRVPGKNRGRPVMAWLAGSTS
jgi:hypothetical protein